MEKVILYTTHCPRCEVLKKKLIQKGVEYTEVDSVEELTNLGITAVPMMRILPYNEYLDFSGAVAWVNSLEE